MVLHISEEKTEEKWVDISQSYQKELDPLEDCEMNLVGFDHLIK